MQRQELLGKVDGLARASELLNEELGRAIRDAHRHGVSLRAMAAVIRKSPESVRRIVQTKPRP